MKIFIGDFILKILWMQVKNDTKIIIFGKNQFFDEIGKNPET
jgi:hypothetical protein